MSNPNEFIRDDFILAWFFLIQISKMFLTHFCFILGNQSRHSEEACTSHFFSSDNESGHLLIAGGSNEDCPFIGRYEKGNNLINM